MPADDERAAGRLRRRRRRRGGRGRGKGVAAAAAAFLRRGECPDPVVAAAPASALPPLLHPIEGAVAADVITSSFLGRNSIPIFAVVVILRRERAAQGPRDGVEHEDSRAASSEDHRAAVGGERRRRFDQVGDPRRQPGQAPPWRISSCLTDGCFERSVSVERAVDPWDQRGAAVSAAIVVEAAIALAVPEVTSSAPSEPARGDQRAPAVKGPQRGSGVGLDGDEGAVEQGDEERVGRRGRGGKGPFVPLFF